MEVSEGTRNFIERVREKHGDTQDQSKTVQTKARNLVCIICKKHGTFQQKAISHLIGHGCPTCGIQKCAKNISVDFESFVQRAREKHGDKFQYRKKTYKDISSKLQIICPVHEVVEMTGASHLRAKTGCPKCRFLSIAESKTISHDEFLRRSKELHGEKQDYSKTFQIQGNQKITITCKVHGDFQQVAAKHLTGGCRKCADDLHTLKRRKPLEKFLEQVKQVHGEKQDYSKIIQNNTHTNVHVICREHGSFFKIAKEFINGQGCPQCREKRTSKVADEWLRFMEVRDNVKIQFGEEGEFRIPETLQHADGQASQTNTIYEFQGSQWHGDLSVQSPEKTNKHNGKTFGELQEKTLKKSEVLREKGYNVIECWESQWIRFKKIVKIFQKRFREQRRGLTK